MNIKKHSLNCLFTILSITLLYNYAAFAQSTDTIQWSEKYGIDKADAFHSIIEVNFEELVAIGTIKSSKKNKNILFARINPANGLLLDNPKELGGPADDFAYRIIQTIADTYVIVGSSKQENGKMQNAFLMELDKEGTEIWTKFSKPSVNAVFSDVVQNKKGDLYVTGQIGKKGKKKACLLKYTSEGDFLWEKPFDIPGETEGLAIKLTEEEDIIIAIHQEKDKHHSTFLQKINAKSDTLWQKEFKHLKIKDLLIEADKIASTGTFYSPEKKYREDLFLLTLTLEGEEINRSDFIRTRGKDGGNALLKSKDGFYYTAGYNTSFASNIGFSKLWVSKMDETRKEVYPDYYLAGGNLEDLANDIIELWDGSLIIAGQSESSSTSLSLKGQSQPTLTSLKKGAWLMKLLPEGYVYVPPPSSSPPPPSSITIAWSNKLTDKDGDIYKASQPVTMTLQAIVNGPKKDIDFTIALNDSEKIDLTSTKSKSEVVGLGKTKRGDYDIDFDPVQLSLKEGLNTISIYIKGKEKPLREFLIEYVPSKPNLHLVSIGIPYDELDYTSKDAKDFANLFASSNSVRGLFKKIEIDTLISKATTKEGDIKKKMQELSRKKDVKSNDYILIFISAHGMIYGNDLWIPASDNEGGTIDAVNFQTDILDRLNDLPCKKIIFIDACNSGKGVKGGEILPSNVLSIITKAANDFYIMTSSSAEQKSYENVAWENGAFTKALKEAFTNKKVDIGTGTPLQANKNDAYLTLAEVFEFTKARVSFLAKSKNRTQTPSINKTLSKFELPIFWFGAN